MKRKSKAAEVRNAKHESHEVKTGRVSHGEAREPSGQNSQGKAQSKHLRSKRTHATRTPARRMRKASPEEGHAQGG